MDLKIKDVAELLSVSETTIRRWLTTGKIPAYKLNHRYRFSRIEIENWMLSCKVHSQDSKRALGTEEQIYPIADEEGTQGSMGMQHFSLFRALHRGEVLFEGEGRSKEEVIRKTMQLLAPNMGLDPDVISELLIDRENLMSTAVNQGIAVPHARDFLLPSPLDSISVLFLKSPMDYGALDGRPVHTLFFLFSSSDKRHLHLLSKIAHLSSQKDALEFLLTRPTKESLLSYIKRWETAIG